MSFQNIIATCISSISDIDINTLTSEPHQWNTPCLLNTTRVLQIKSCLYFSLHISTHPCQISTHATRSLPFLQRINVQRMRFKNPMLAQRIVTKEGKKRTKERNLLSSLPHNNPALIGYNNVLVLSKRYPDFRDWKK